MKYLGHIILAEGVATDPEKVSVVAQWRRPGSMTELRSFLGFASYYCRFVEGFASVAAPLHKLVGALQGGKSMQTFLNLLFWKLMRVTVVSEQFCLKIRGDRLGLLHLPVEVCGPLKRICQIIAR